MMKTQLRDIVDVFVAGLLFEITRELRMEFDGKPVSDSTIGERVEASVLVAMEHECLLEHSSLLAYVRHNKLLTKWYEKNENRYSDHFLEVLPMREPYTSDPEKYANIWANFSSQMIGAIVGNIREDGF